MTPIFRPEAIAAQRNRLVGHVQIAIPMQWSMIVAFILALSFAAVLFLLTIEFDRTEQVNGVIWPDKGVSKLALARPGTVDAVFVKQGDTVRQGQKLAVFRTDESLLSGSTMAAVADTALVDQDRRLKVEEEEAQKGLNAHILQILEDISSLKKGTSDIATQIDIQTKLVNAANAEYQSANSLSARGFISKHDLLEKEDAYLTREQQLSQLNKSLVEQTASLDEKSSLVSQLKAESGVQLAGIEASRAQLIQQRAAVSAGSVFVLRTPITGTVATLSFKVGERIQDQPELVTIIPAGSRLRAEVNVPPEAIGFIKRGQSVRLSLTAFPFQKFGTLAAVVSSIGQTALHSPDPNGQIRSFYPIVADINKKAVYAYGSDLALMSGMTFSARIVTRRENLYDWIFDPVIAVEKR